MKSSQFDYSQCTPIVTHQSHYYYNPFKSSYLNARYMLDTAQVYTVTNADIGRLPNISYKFYGTVSLWRIICQVNQVSDPISDIYPGRTLVIPKLSQITDLINNSNIASKSEYSNSSFVI